MGLNALLGAIQGGDYISGVKLVPPLIVLLIWARLLTWADKDAVDAHLPRVPLNISFLGGLIVAFALFFLASEFLHRLPGPPAPLSGRRSERISTSASRRSDSKTSRSSSANGSCR